MIFLSMLYSLPLVSAVYTVEEHYMPPELDDSEAICALKTRTDGYFYRPNLAIDLLKIEMLFDNQNIVGDQIGGTSPYSTITAYPDGEVDLRDVYFVSIKYGLVEGQSGWDYMADLVPDGTIDLKDYYTVCLNYGKSGTYITSLAGVTVTFNTGQTISPDSDGFVTIPSGATSFTVKRYGTPIGAMVIFYGPRELPIAYSTTFDFTVPAYTGGDVGKEVWYYILARLYVPSELSGQNFYFVATADYRVQNVKMNGYSKTGSGSSVNSDLGKLGGGYHLLEFEFVDISGGGSLSFHVATATSQYAWLSRFRIYVPNYSDNRYEYNVEVWTTFSMEDEYYLKGYADDFINSLHTDGLLWDGWMWNLSSTETIYMWGDGFLYPFGRKNRDYNCSISFIFGEMWEGGLLDFQVISWTNQTDRIGAPKFYALANVFPGYKRIYEIDNYGLVENATVYGGSKWNGTVAVSDRFFECRARMNSNVTAFDNGVPTGCGLKQELEIGLGVGWAELVLPKANNDLGITLNFTVINSTEIINGEIIPHCGLWLYELDDYSVDVYSYSGLDIMGAEFTGTENVESIINPGWTAAVDYIGNVIMFVSTILGSPEGVAVGLTLKGTALLVASTKFIEGQSLPSYTTTISEFHHYRVNATRGLEIYDEELPYSLAGTAFFKLNPNIGYTCGLTKITLRGLLTVTGPMILGGHWETYPIGSVEITICVPWFIW